MEVICFSKYTHTGMLIKDVLRKGGDLLFDMATPFDCDLKSTLLKHGSSVERVRHIFITHFHGDHYNAKVAWEMAQEDTMIHMDQDNWILYENEPLCAELRPFHQKILDAGKVNFLAPRGEMQLGEYKLVWDNFFHDNCRSLAFRIDDVFITGDGATQEIFNENRENTDRLLCIKKPVVKKLIVQINEISIENMKLRNYPQEEIDRKSNGVGTFEELEKAMRKESFHSFFMNLEVIQPNHLRVPPLEETAKIITQKLNKIKEEFGYKYKVIF